MSIKSSFNVFANDIVTFIGKINWPFKGGITPAEVSVIKAALVPNYYIILTRHNNHLSTYFIGLADFFLTGKWGYWAHALMNCEDSVPNDGAFRLIQATGKGTNFATFDEVFTTSSVALLKPKSMSLDYWTTVLDRLKSDIGKPYDTLFDLSQDQKLSCVQLVRNALQAEPNYAVDFANFEAMINKYHHRLTPSMFANCPDFEIVYLVKH